MLQPARQAGPLPDYADKTARRLTFLNYTEKRNLREMQFAEGKSKDRKRVQQTLRRQIPCKYTAYICTHPANTLHCHTHTLERDFAVCRAVCRRRT